MSEEVTQTVVLDNNRVKITKIDYSEDYSIFDVCNKTNKTIILSKNAGDILLIKIGNNSISAESYNEFCNEIINM